MVTSAGELSLLHEHTKAHKTQLHSTTSCFRGFRDPDLLGYSSKYWSEQNEDMVGKSQVGRANSGGERVLLRRRNTEESGRTGLCDAAEEGEKQAARLCDFPGERCL